MEKKFDVCILGNAVVDGFVRVDDALLNKYQLKKADYRHFSHGELMALNEDIMLEHFSAGGSGANVGSSLAQLGLKMAHLGRVGADPAGQHFYEEMEQAGVYMAKPDATARTFQIFVLLTPDGERTFVEPDTSAVITSDWLDRDVIKQSKTLLIEGYPLLDQADVVLEAINIAKAEGVSIVLMLAPPTVMKKAADVFNQVITLGVDLVFSDTEEAEAIVELLTSEAREKWQVTPRVQTMSGDGARFIAVGQPEVFLGCQKIETPIDVTGAGEAFAAGFLAGYLRKKEPAVCLSYGHKLGGQVIQQMGARLKDLNPEMFNQNKCA
ncbi:MAG: adenosine kinase [Alphaproteobacteria bacterium]|nr:adenosine kinase [Alphaproteobacteria bacterium]MDD9920207.1 adenosine kinase [Alphaproteobacteria bacterium]